MSDETSAAIAERVAKVVYHAMMVAGDTRQSPRPWVDGGNSDMQGVARRAASDVIGILDAGRAAASSDLDAIKREAAREALTYVRDQFEMRPALPRDIALAVVDMALRNRYPAPVPEPPHVRFNDGSVVTYHANDLECPWRRDYANSTTLPPRITNASQWSDIFNPTDTGADFDSLKAFAGRVLALREGRGDDA